MMDARDGGPVYPVVFQHRRSNGEIHAQEWGGMTLRDYFAGQALAGDLAAWTREDDGSFKPEDVAIRCYKVADAMLRERAKERS